MLSIITPTRNRPFAFSLLEGYFLRMAIPFETQWVVVNDGSEDYGNNGQTYIRRTPQPGEKHSLCENVLCALDHCSFDRIAVLEDDDWYSVNYLSTLCYMLGKADLCGFSFDSYFYLPTRNQSRGSLDVLNNRVAASFAATGFTSAVVPLVRSICQRGHPVIDNPLWGEWSGSKLLLDNRTGPYHVGMKGMPGEPNVTGRRPQGRRSRLSAVIGEEASVYQGVR